MENNRVEIIISSLSSVKTGLQALLGVYQRLPNVFQKENEAIARVDIAEVENFAAEKLRMSAHVEETSTQILKSLRDAVQLVDSSQEWHGIGEGLEILAVKHDFPVGLSQQLLLHLLTECQKLHRQFKQAYEELAPQFVIHREVVAQRLQNFRESYRFWLRIEQELTQGYDQKGQKTDQGSGSLFQTKA